MKGEYDIFDLVEFRDLPGPVLSCVRHFRSVISDTDKRGEFKMYKAES